MARSVQVTPLQIYSSSLAAYTLKQFSAARAALDDHQEAAAKLPATHSHDYRAHKSSFDSAQSSESPPDRPAYHSDDSLQSEKKKSP
ncbi:hypothetical protein H0H92_013757 [Tricholoma furcatifolium]|nr:hypothetical protein H0H92_013757 [Tricholoma furcatifolium]